MQTNLPLQFEGVGDARLPAGPLHLAIGMFDGVHLGHRAVIGPAVRAARATGGVAAVLTFWPHPSALFRPQDPTRLIQDPATKAEVLATIGIDAVITERFTTEFAQLEAEAFLPWLQQRLPSLVAVYVGENFQFGHRRRGNAELLARSGAALRLEVHTARRLTVNDEPASSTRIRSHLTAGEIEAANALLGYRYFARGVVATGKRLGRTLGFPTLNLTWSPELRPRFGVYAVEVVGPDGKARLPGVANYGLRPTVENATEPKLEVHLLGACPYDAGDRITVEWRHFLRPEMKFAGLDALRAQITADRTEAERLLAPRPA
ncbi:riboflavin biosynthesis protein RibF [Opitutus sp. ER46]|uniref:riboflavin biosynthesis protein RibF n=1 Tax=Opitutus sp. ER46 TaxID=2161864 RepID=UPI000D3084AE|nr:riboflavin biosynthesis protein RibF [Opitutus sp. ER46]PTX91147.1 riboflavin biosynthesis protein RibF [Opitutus sp. ER46]